MSSIEIKSLFEMLRKIQGGYEYSGACSFQVCFPLKSGGELRFSLVDEDVLEEDSDEFQIDLYDGTLPPMITGFSIETGKTT
jgi:hypothetical protein